MRILYHHRVASKDGQYVHIEEMVRCLREAGHEVDMVCPDADGVGIGGVAPGVSGIRERLPAVISELLEFIYAFYDFGKLSISVLRHRPDFIYERYNLYLPSGIWIKRLFRLPLFVEINAPLYAERSVHSGLVLGRLAKWSERYVWRGADIVLPVTTVLGDMVAKQGVNQSVIHVIPNGVDMSAFAPRPKDASLRSQYCGNASLILGFVGFVREWHGIDRVIRVLSQIDDLDWRLLIVGEGPATAPLNALAMQLGCTDRVVMIGLVEREAIPAHIALFDIALQPDVVPYASPLKLIEYMAMGRAIIAVDRPNVRELLTHGIDGYLLKPDDDAALDAALRTLCADSGLRKRLAEGALRTVHSRRLYWSANAQRVVELALPLLSKSVSQGKSD